jgi:hypothetical protein
VHKSARKYGLPQALEFICLHGHNLTLHQPQTSRSLFQRHALRFTGITQNPSD